MFGFHVKSAVAMSASEAVKFGFLAWGLLALSMGIIFLVVLVFVFPVLQFFVFPLLLIHFFALAQFLLVCFLHRFLLLFLYFHLHIH